MDDFTEEERQEYADKWEEVDQKALLAQILGELGAIRMQLEQMNQQGPQGAQSNTERCQACREQVPVNQRLDHAIQEHNAPKDMAVDNLPMFK